MDSLKRPYVPSGCDQQGRLKTPLRHHRRIAMGWTCCECCHSWHSNRVYGFLHYLWLRITRQC